MLTFVILCVLVLALIFMYLENIITFKKTIIVLAMACILPLAIFTTWGVIVKIVVSVEEISPYNITRNR